MKLHDDVLLMCGLSGRAGLFPSPTDARRNEASEIWHGLLPHTDPRKEPSRTAKILDALAQVGVNDKEVIAVAVARQASPKTILPYSLRAMKLFPFLHSNTIIPSLSKSGT